MSKDEQFPERINVPIDAELSQLLDAWSLRQTRPRDRSRAAAFRYYAKLGAQVEREQAQREHDKCPHA